MEDYIKIEEIEDKYNTRLFLDEAQVQKLTSLISKEQLKGTLFTVFKKDDNNKYVIASGRHRFNAIKRINSVNGRYDKFKVDRDIAIYNEEPSYQRALELSRMENTQLKQTILDEGQQYQYILEQGSTEGKSKEELIEEISKDYHEKPTHVKDAVRVYKALIEINPKVLNDIRNRRINQTQLLQVLNAQNHLSPKHAKEIYQLAINGKTSQELRRYIKTLRAMGKEDSKKVSVEQIARETNVKNIYPEIGIYVSVGKELTEKYGKTMNSLIVSYLKTGKPELPKNLFVNSR